MLECAVHAWVLEAQQGGGRKETTSPCYVNYYETPSEQALDRTGTHLGEHLDMVRRMAVVPG